MSLKSDKTDWHISGRLLQAVADSENHTGNLARIASSVLVCVLTCCRRWIIP